MPMLQHEFSRSAGTADFLGVDTDDSRSPASALLAYARVAYPQGEDSKAQLRSALRVPGLPVTLVFDRQGRLVLRQVGQVSVGTLRKAIQDASAT